MFLLLEIIANVARKKEKTAINEMLCFLGTRENKVMGQQGHKSKDSEKTLVNKVSIRIHTHSIYKHGRHLVKLQ